MMNLDEIRQILDMVREHELAEFELEQDGVKLRLRKGAAPVLAAAVAAPLVAPPAAPVQAPAQAVAAVAGVDEGEELVVITAPIVGTFYRLASPESGPFVEVGSLVKKGQTLCIIEAMKLMNEIEAEHEGEVVKVYVENGQPVQYGDRLFALKRA